METFPSIVFKNIFLFPRLKKLKVYTEDDLVLKMFGVFTF